LIKVHWVPTISSVTAPTEAEIAAGTELTPFITPAGINLPDEGSEADASDLSSERDKSVPSTVGGNPEAECYRDDTTDTAWTTLTRGTSGYLVVARFGGSGTDNAIQATDEVEVWTVRVSSRNPVRVARGETQRFQSVFTVEADPEYSATVAS
jgi:hypothetical protein